MRAGVWQGVAQLGRKGSPSVLTFPPFVFAEQKEERFQSFGLDVEFAAVCECGCRVKGINPMLLISVRNNDHNT